MASEATETNVKAALALMLGAGLAQSAKTEGSDMGLAYAMVLSEVPSVVLKQAAMAIASGKAAGFDDTYMPSAQKVLAYCEKLKADYLAKATMTERLLALPEEKLPDPADETRERDMRGKLQALAQTVRRA